MPEGNIPESKKLTEQQVAQYWRDGYIFPLDLLSRQRHKSGGKTGANGRITVR